ncbi:MAG: hypothetical protein DHS20C02_17600 [Micavibrio sp.]|nr:MAG: hypothetical protein DHS20C02_17600 [Micavibrio sp.]
MKRQAGFTLVEIAIVMVIVGLLLVAAASVFNTVDKKTRRSTTIQRMEVIMDAMSAFALRNYRIPCPADPRRITGGGEPFGSEGGSNATGTSIGGCAGAGRADGLVPFFTLQLGEDDVRDGWGNYITYKVNPDFTEDPEEEGTDVHASCRTTEWIEAGRNKNAEKARFCCNGENRGAEIVICQNPLALNVGTCNTAATGRISLFDRDGANGLYVDGPRDPSPGGVDIQVNSSDATPAPFGTNNPYYQPNIYDPTQTNIETIAYALISHGPNEVGAFVNSGVRIGGVGVGGVPTIGGTHEILNANNTQLGVWALERNDANNATYFDDIVRFSTQGMILARLGKDSCAVP